MTKDDKRLLETPYLRMIDRNGWYFVQRSNASGVVTVAALTAASELLLVEQFRPAVQARVMELPAGLCGDLGDATDESLETAARRELLEETGYEVDSLTEVYTGPTSAGLTDEQITFFLGRQAVQRTAGGGDESEDIQVWKTPLEGIDRWLDDCISRGVVVDTRVYTGLYLLQKHGLV